MHLARLAVPLTLPLALAQPATADVIFRGPPLAPLHLSNAQIAQRAKAARAAVAAIFESSGAPHPAFLDDAYRAALKLGISRVERIVSVSVLGDRAFVLAVTVDAVAPQVLGSNYTYLQCRFDDDGQVVAINFLP